MAIHGVNVTADNDDLLIVPELVTSGVSIIGDDYGFFSSPTPGSFNPDHFSLAPTIHDVTHTPTLPTRNDEVVVTARIEQTLHNVDNVSLTYRVMFEDEVSVVMVDDGTGKDEEAGDGIYTAVIPAGAATRGEMLRYFVTASDVTDDSCRAPRILDKTGTDRSPEYFGTIVQDETLDGELPVFHWFAESLAQGRKRAGTRASVFYEGEFYDNIFVRQRAVPQTALRKNSTSTTTTNSMSTRS